MQLYDICPSTFLLLPLISDLYKALHLLPTLVQILHRSLYTQVQCAEICVVCTRQHEGKKVWLGLQRTLWGVG